MLSTYDYSYDIYNVSVSLYDEVQPPKLADYKETETLLCDFGINNVIVPVFNSLSQLLSWRKIIINNFFNNLTCEHEALPQRRLSSGRKRKITIEQFEPYYQRIAETNFNGVIKEAIAADLSVSLNTINLLIREMRYGKR